MVWQLTVRHSRDSGNPRVVGVNVGYASRPPDSERYRLLPLAKLIEHVYYYIHMTHRSPCHSDQIHKATEATRCLMPENQKKTPRSKLTKRNPDSKPNSDPTPASDGQIQRPEMTGNGREIEISELTFRQQAALPRIALAKSLGLSADCGIAPPHMAAYDPLFPRKRDSKGSGCLCRVPVSTT